MTPVRPPHTPDPLNLRGPLDGPRWRRAEPAQSRRPGRSRPGGAPLRYHRTGVGMSRTGHGSRPVPPATTVGLALLAAAITLWLGLVAQFGQMITGGSADGSADSTGRVPDRLAVVR
ncbi:cell wall hydrolase ChiZ, partial [Mycobacterium tuberculosis]